MAKSFDMDEEEIDFRVEAEAVMKDIGFTVKSINISSKLPASRECVYLNVLTKESKCLCVELSVLGFLVVGERFDENIATSASKYYETINALLDSISPGYCHSFGEALVQRLSSLQTAVDGQVNSPVPDK
ncbi:GSK3-beta interaction protein-like isoform X2 [Acropora palmata]